MLANKGLKVLIVDADPQCNLTGLALGIKDYDSLSAFYEKKNSGNIYDYLAGHFGYGNTIIKPDAGASVSDTKNHNLKILAGHIEFSSFDLQIATALTSSETIPLLKPLIGAMNNMIRKTAEQGDFDIVLIDMSPSVSATNMCVFMASDYFLLPTSPDFYCYQAIDSMSKVFPLWANRLEKFKDGVSLPRSDPRMLGVISQNYRVYNRGEDEANEMAQEFKKWADKIREITRTNLIPALKENDMIVPEADFRECVDYDTPYNIANIPNFNSLVPAAQSHSKPFFELVQEDSDWTGAIWHRVAKNGKEVGAKVNIEKSLDIYSRFSDAVLGMLKYKIT